jgi:hypothetical protein
MPTLSISFGIIIRMYYDGHPPPHFHAIYGEHEAKIGIETLELIEGRLPRRALGWFSTGPNFIDRSCATIGSGVRSTKRSPLSRRWSRGMNRIVSVSAGLGYTLHVLFDDGRSGEVDLSARLFGPVFEPLRDQLLFAQVRVDEYGAVCWPNGADLAPDALYRTISSQVEPGVLAS